MSGDFHIDPSSLKPGSIDIQQAQEAEIEELMEQVAAENSMQEFAEEGFNSIAQRRNFRPIQEQKRKAKAGEESALEGKKIKGIKDAEETADKFHNRNPELRQKTLLILRNKLKQGDSAEDILRKVLETYPDYTLADEALEFLLETTTGDLQKNVRIAKQALNAYYEREIKAGRNIAEQAKEFSEKGLGTRTSLRDMYRDITGNPRTPQTLFDELSAKFDFAMLNKVADFLLHSLGSDLKAKGPSIAKAELKRLIDDARSLQAILGLYTFFQSRMDLIKSQFKKHELFLPPRITFEELSKRFMLLLKERYLSPERVYMQGRALGISDEILAQIIIFMQMRDGVRQVAPKFYRDDKHRQEVLESFIEALEELEDQLEEEEEDE